MCAVDLGRWLSSLASSQPAKRCCFLTGPLWAVWDLLPRYLSHQSLPRESCLIHLWVLYGSSSALHLRLIFGFVLLCYLRFVLHLPAVWLLDETRPDTSVLISADSFNPSSAGPTRPCTGIPGHTGVIFSYKSVGQLIWCFQPFLLAMLDDLQGPFQPNPFYDSLILCHWGHPRLGPGHCPCPRAMRVPTCSAAR